MMNQITRLTRLVNEDNKTPMIGEFEKHTKGFGSGDLKKYWFEQGNDICKNAQGRQEPIPFIKNNKKASVDANGATLGGMMPNWARVDGKQPKPNDKKTSSHQIKVNKINTPSTSKAKPYASQSLFCADYVLTSDDKGKVVAKYVRYCTKGQIDQNECVGAQGSRY